MWLVTGNCDRLSADKPMLLSLYNKLCKRHNYVDHIKYCKK